MKLKIKNFYIESSKSCLLRIRVSAKKWFCNFVFFPRFIFYHRNWIPSYAIYEEEATLIEFSLKPFLFINIVKYMSKNE
jgi:hypothetical protein